MTSEEVPKERSKGEPQILSVVGIPSAEGFGNPTAWLTYKFAPEWFVDALREARTGADHHARRREILFSVCCAESYLLEWVRDEVLNRDFQKLNHYFPPGNVRNVTTKWKEVPKQLLVDGSITSIPDLSGSYWENWLELVHYRNGLIHARSSRPETASLPDEQRPVPSKTTLDNLQAGWSVRVVVELIGQLHKAVGTATPSWLEMP